MDGIEDYEGNEFRWAVETALSPVFEAGEQPFARSAEALVEDAWDFIVGSFEDVELDPPDRAQLVEAVKVEMREYAPEWIFNDVLEGGQLVTDAALSDEQWQQIEQTIRAVHIEPPSRSAVDAMIADRLRG